MAPTPSVRRHFTASAFTVWNGCTLLLLHSRKSLWLPPGGHVEPDEAPAATAVREVWEETGLQVEITSPRLPEGEPRALPRPEAVLEVEVEPGHLHVDMVFFARPAAGADPRSVHPNEEASALRWWTETDLREGNPSSLPGLLPFDVVSLALRALRGNGDRL